MIQNLLARKFVLTIWSGKHTTPYLIPPFDRSNMKFDSKPSSRLANERKQRFKPQRTTSKNNRVDLASNHI